MSKQYDRTLAFLNSVFPMDESVSVFCKRCRLQVTAELDLEGDSTQMGNEPYVDAAGHRFSTKDGLVRVETPAERVRRSLPPVGLVDGAGFM